MQNGKMVKESLLGDDNNATTEEVELFCSPKIVRLYTGVDID